MGEETRHEYMNIDPPPPPPNERSSDRPVALCWLELTFSEGKI